MLKRKKTFRSSAKRQGDESDEKKYEAYANYADTVTREATLVNIGPLSKIIRREMNRIIKILK
jgi:hypothetical protein